MGCNTSKSQDKQNNLQPFNARTEDHNIQLEKFQVLKLQRLIQQRKQEIEQIYQISLQYRNSQDEGKAQLLTIQQQKVEIKNKEIQGYIAEVRLLQENIKSRVSKDHQINYQKIIEEGEKIFEDGLQVQQKIIKGITAIKAQQAIQDATDTIIQNSVPKPSEQEFNQFMEQLSKRDNQNYLSDQQRQQQQQYQILNDVLA